MSLLPQDSLGLPFAGAMMIFLPFIYGLVGFITTAIGCMVYNLIAQWIGGIEVEVETIETGALQ